MTSNNNGAPGMTLRDWFAGQATDEDIKAHRKWREKRGAFAGVGAYDCTREQARYCFADAMLAAREKGEEDE